MPVIDALTVPPGNNPRITAELTTWERHARTQVALVRNSRGVPVDCDLRPLR